MSAAEVALIGRLSLLLTVWGRIQNRGRLLDCEVIMPAELAEVMALAVAHTVNR